MRMTKEAKQQQRKKKRQETCDDNRHSRNGELCHEFRIFKIFGSSSLHSLSTSSSSIGERQSEKEDD
jgi:hypothetical protein